MRKTELFEGKRLLDERSLFTKSKGKVRLSCRIEEEWREQYSVSSACGIPIKYSLKRTVGISSTERASLESTVSAKLGLKDVWEISSAVKGTMGYELRLDESVEEVGGFEASPPKCGRLILRIFQLYRLYTFHYRDDRFWGLRLLFLRRKSSSHTTQERLNQWWNDPDIIDPIPECKCEPEGGKGLRTLLGIAFEKFGMHVDYQQTTEAVVVPSLGLSFLGRRVEDILGKEIVVDSTKLPPHLLFLSGETANSLTGVIMQHRDIHSGRQTPRLEKRPMFSRGALGLGILVGIGLISSGLLRRATKRDLRVSKEVLREKRPMFSRGALGLGILVGIGLISSGLLRRATKRDLRVSKEVLREESALEISQSVGTRVEPHASYRERVLSN